MLITGIDVESKFEERLDIILEVEDSVDVTILGLTVTIGCCLGAGLF